MEYKTGVIFQVTKGFREQWGFLLACRYLSMLLWNWVSTVGKQKMIWNILAGEKWFNLQAAGNNIYIWC